MCSSAEALSIGADGAIKRDISVEDPSQGYVIGIDLGGTKILAGIADAAGQVLATLEEPTRHGEGAPVLDQMAAIARNLIAEIEKGEEQLLGVVIGIPSVVAPLTGLASLSPNLALPSDRALADLMAARLSCPITVENDVNLAAYGEAKAGLGRQENSLAFVSFGTGVGMGLVLNGELWRGDFGRAGEIGYMPVGPTPHLHAPSSENGLFEDAVGSRAIRERFVGDGGSVIDLFSAARAGDGSALAALDEIARSASLGLATIHALFDPAVTVVGGGIGSQPDFFALLVKHLAPLLPFDCRVERSHFGTQAGMMGAIMLAIRNINEATRQLRASAE